MYNPNEKDIDLTREYFPSYHTARFQDKPEPNVAVQENFIQVTAEHRKDIISKNEIKLDNLRYGGTDDEQQVDVFYKNEDPSPLFVFIHGGYWQMLSKTNACSIVEPMVRRGYRVTVMDYNNCPQVTLEQLMEQFSKFLVWIFDYAEKIQATEISFAAHSAGAHLLAILLHSPTLISEQWRKKVRALFFICGVYDLRELWALEGVNPNNIFSLNADSAIKCSPILWSWKEDSPSWSSVKSYVISTKYESVTFIEQSRVFAKNLQDGGFEVTFKLFDNYDHFDIIEDTILDNSPITEYLMAALQNAAK